MITLFMRTNRFNPAEPQYIPSITKTLNVPTDNNYDLMSAAFILLNQVWKDDFRYIKARVILSDFYEPGIFQPGLFEEYTGHPNDKSLMSVIDQINHSGKRRLFLRFWARRKTGK